MRGPLSDQPHKIGKHVCGVIDHVFFSRHFLGSRHAWLPLTYATPADARRDLLPSLSIPSDHAPVVVDLFRTKGLNARTLGLILLLTVGAALFAVAARANSSRSRGNL